MGKLTRLAEGQNFSASHFPKDFGAYTGGQDPRDNSLLGMRRGGKVKHPDAMQDKALIKQEMKKEAAAEPPMMAKAKGGKVKAHKAKMPKMAKPVVGTLDKMPVNRAPANVMARHTPPDMTPPAGGLPYGVQPSMKRPMPTVGGDRPGMGGPITQMSRGGRTKR